jgi:intein/homing endonuclease
VKDKEGVISFAAYNPEEIGAFELHEDITVEKLEIDGRYINVNGEWKIIESLDLEPFKGLVYNITVEDTHTFIANNIVVHNIGFKKV